MVDYDCVIFHKGPAPCAKWGGLFIYGAEPLAVDIPIAHLSPKFMDDNIFKISCTAIGIQGNSLIIHARKD